MMKGWDFVQSRADFLLFFLFWTMDHRTRLVPIATTIDGTSTLDLANARKSSFYSTTLAKKKKKKKKKKSGHFDCA